MAVFLVKPIAPATQLNVIVSGTSASISFQVDYDNTAVFGEDGCFLTLFKPNYDPAVTSTGGTYQNLLTSISGASSSPVGTLASGTSARTFNDLLPGSYFVQIVPGAVTANAPGAYASQMFTIAQSMPVAPSGITVSAVTDTSMSVAVATNPAYTSYALEYRTGSGAWTASAAQVSNVFAISGLTLATIYEFRAKGIANGIDSLYSATLTQSTANPVGNGSQVPTTLIAPQVSVGASRSLTAALKNALNTGVAGVTYAVNATPAGRVSVSGVAPSGANGEDVFTVTGVSAGSVTLQVECSGPAAGQTVLSNEMVIEVVA